MSDDYLRERAEEIAPDRALKDTGAAQRARELLRAIEAFAAVEDSVETSRQVKDRESDEENVRTMRESETLVCGVPLATAPKKTVKKKAKNSKKKVTRYTYDQVEPRTPETGHTALLPGEDKVVTVSLDNGWSEAIKVGRARWPISLIASSSATPTAN